MPRALFVCSSEERFAAAKLDGPRSFKLTAVTPQAGTPDESDPEVNAFWSATPSGQVTIYITNPAAYLEVGKRYYVDFTEHP